MLPTAINISEFARAKSDRSHHKIPRTNTKRES